MSILAEGILVLLFIAFMATGVVSIVIPLLPSAILIWVGVFIYAYLTEFAVITWSIFGLITVIALSTGVADLWLTPWGARKGGASGMSLLWGGIGAFVGSFFAPILGTIVGYAGGVLLSEYGRHGDIETAAKASLGSLAGWGLGAVVQMIGSIFILAIFLWQIFAG